MRLETVLKRIGNEMIRHLPIAAVALVVSPTASAQTTQRIPLPPSQNPGNADLPIAAAVWAGDTLYVSGWLDPELKTRGNCAGGRRMPTCRNMLFAIGHFDLKIAGQHPRLDESRSELSRDGKALAIDRCVGRHPGDHRDCCPRDSASAKVITASGVSGVGIAISRRRGESSASSSGSARRSQSAGKDKEGRRVGGSRRLKHEDCPPTALACHLPAIWPKYRFDGLIEEFRDGKC
jgi:hypothetical protein